MIELLQNILPTLLLIAAIQFALIYSMAIALRRYVNHRLHFARIAAIRLVPRDTRQGLERAAQTVNLLLRNHSSTFSLIPAAEIQVRQHTQINWPEVPNCVLSSELLEAA